MSDPTTIPSKMRALVTLEKSVARIQEVDVPTLEDNTILVKTKTVALNPTDWKHIKFIGHPGTICGCDFAGEVVKIGPNPNPKVSLKIGDRVMGAVHGGAYADRGAFAEYVKADADTVWKIPDDSVSFEQAATMGVGPMTAVQGLFHPERLGLVEPPERVAEETWVFVYGGSTAVGYSAIQFLHLIGYKVVTVASPRNHDLVKSLGADAVFDYKDPDTISKIKQLTKDSIHTVVDTISEESSQIFAVNTLAPGPGKVLIILPVNPKASGLRSDVSFIPTLLYTAFGRSFSLGDRTIPGFPQDKIQVSNFLIDKFPGLVKEGKLKPMPVKLGEGGLDGINDGLDYMEAGKVSAEKLVYRIS